MTCDGSTRCTFGNSANINGTREYNNKLKFPKKEVTAKTMNLIKDRKLTGDSLYLQLFTTELRLLELLIVQLI